MGNLKNKKPLYEVFDFKEDGQEDLIVLCFKCRKAFEENTEEPCTHLVGQVLEKYEDDSSR